MAFLLAMCFRIATICTSKLNDFLPQFTDFRNALFQFFQHSARSQTAAVEIARNLVEVVPDASSLSSQLLNFTNIGNDVVVEGGRIVVRFKYEQSIQDAVRALHTE